MDDFTRESPALRTHQRLIGDNDAATLEHVIRGCGKPRVIRVDNGPEFTSKSRDQWAYAHDVELDFIRPGKPTDNATIDE